MACELGIPGSGCTSVGGRLENSDETRKLANMTFKYFDRTDDIAPPTTPNNTIPLDFIITIQATKNNTKFFVFIFILEIQTFLRCSKLALFFSLQTQQ